ncbi:thioredoxin domain-containing protein [Rhodobacterales bacterium HKCCE3408]|nr:thioredoxin domain-containing protein [Rhodobacterales bacterium HKCCE3408]
MHRRLVLGSMGAAAFGAGGMTLLGRTPAARAQETGDGAPEIMEMTIGEADAPVEFIEYASYTCPHCANFHANVFPMLKADYIDTGMVRFVYRNFYRNRPDLWAAMVARCAGPMRFFGVNDILYTTQSEWIADDPATIVENLRRIGRSVGLSDGDLDACLSDGEMAQALVDRFEGFLEIHPAEGTPSFVIQGELYSGLSYDDMRGIIDAALQEAGVEVEG